MSGHRILHGGAGPHFDEAGHVEADTEAANIQARKEGLGDRSRFDALAARGNH